MKSMKVEFNRYQYGNYPANYMSVPSFRGIKANTMQEKITVLLAETKKMYLSGKNPKLADFETIIKKISPTTTVRNFSEIPPDSNANPRTGAYFRQKTQINILTNEMQAEDKIMYLNLNHPKQWLFGDFVHEATHIAQEEATNRENIVDFTKRLLQSGLTPDKKHHSLVSGVKGFASVEYNIVQPLFKALQKDSELPKQVPYADKYILNEVYKQLTGYNVSDFIRLVTKDIVGQLRQIYPMLDEKYVVSYIRKQAGNEKEAYSTGLDFLKDILKIKGSTDLDLRVLLYDEFEKTTSNMIL